MRRSTAWLAALLTAATFTSATTCFTQGVFAQVPVPDDAAKAKAAELKKQGDALMDALKYLDALNAYDQAYALSHDPAIRYNRGRAYQALGRFPEALEELEAFQAEGSAELKAKVPKLVELIADVRLHIAKLELKCNVDGARVLVRDKVVGTTPITQPLALSVGPATLEITVEGYFPFKQSLTLPAGGKLVVDAVLVTKQTKGILVVKSGVAGATAFVDDKLVGTVPAEVVVDPGTHKIVVRRDQYDDAETSTLVPVGERKEITVDLGEKGSITSKWWFWTGIGAVVVVGGVTAYYAYTHERSPSSGDLPPGQTRGPLSLFHF